MENELESPVKMKRINKPRTTGEKRQKKVFLQYKEIVFPNETVSRRQYETMTRGSKSGGFFFPCVHYCVATGPVATATFSPKGS